MRFLKIHDGRFKADIMHIWIEDDCPEWLLKEAQLLLKKAFNASPSYSCTERKFDLVSQAKA